MGVLVPSIKFSYCLYKFYFIKDLLFSAFCLLFLILQFLLTVNFIKSLVCVLRYQLFSKSSMRVKFENGYVHILLIGIIAILVVVESCLII